MIGAACAQCGHQYQVGEQHAGKTLRCKQCRGVVRVPGNGDFPDLELDEFRYLETDGSEETAAPQPRRRKKSRRAGSSAGGRPAISLSIVAAVLVVLFNGMLRVLDVTLGDAPPGRLALQLPLAALVLAAIAFRVRLGWQFARITSAIAAVLLFVALLSRGLAGTTDVSLFLSAVIPMALHLGIIAALERPSARDWFALTCPKCGSPRGGPADIVFRAVQCKDCGARWS